MEQLKHPNKKLAVEHIWKSPCFYEKMKTNNEID